MHLLSRLRTLIWPAPVPELPLDADTQVPGPDAWLFWTEEDGITSIDVEQDPDLELDFDGDEDD